MKKSPTTTILMVILVASALCSVLFCGLYVNNAMRLRDLQRSAAIAQNNRNLLISLANDTLEYSKRNSAVDPILEAAGFKPKTAAAPTTKASGK
jgi:hypothetical protein